MQDRVLGLFHYALQPKGVLFLGPSESVEQAPDQFAPVEKNFGIYRREKGAQKRIPTMALDQRDLPEPPGPQLPTEETNDYEQLHWSFLKTHAPPSLLVNDQYDLVHVTEGAQRFLEYPAGVPTQDVLQVVRPDLRVDLRTALFQVFGTENEDDWHEDRRVRLDLDGEGTLLIFRVRRIDDDRAEPLAMITFEEHEVDSMTEGDTDDEAAATIRQLEQELEQTKEQLALTIEEYEGQTEELQASNEELQSMNEELKSTTEELETSKEELQSVNEELYTVNQELQDKNKELSQANSDLRNLMASTGIGVIFLDRSLNLRRFTPPARELFNFIPADEGRPLSDLRGKIDYDEERGLTEDAERVLDSLQPVEREVQKGEGRWYLVRILPYRTQEDKINGVVINFIDITNRKETELELREREQELRDLNETLEEKVEQRTREIRELSSELTLAEQNERDRISQVLHDELQQELHAVQMWAKALETDNLSDEQKELLRQIRETLGTSLERTQSLAAELSPPVLESTAFAEILQWLALHVEQTYGLDVEMELEEECRIPEEEVRTLLFRLVRELLFNAVKHAGVGEVRLQSRRRKDGRLVVEVIDSGTGFDPDTLDQKEAGSGLHTVRNRLSMIGGTLEIESTPGEGTRATLVLPLDIEAEDA